MGEDQELYPEFVRDFPVDQLVPYPGNVRLHDLESKLDSLDANGRYKPLVVQRSTKYVLTGNGTLDAAVNHRGCTTMPVLLIDVDDDHARRINLADNATADKGTYDFEALAAVLAEYADEGDMMGTGYTMTDYEAILEQIGGMGEPPPAPALPAPPAAAPGSYGGGQEDRDNEREEDPGAPGPELVLHFPDEATLIEFGTLLTDAATALGDTLTPAAVALRGARLLNAALAARDQPDRVDLAEQLTELLAELLAAADGL